jgi:hypothetical protein
MAKRGPKRRQTVGEQLLEQARVTNRLLAAVLAERFGQNHAIRLLSTTTLTAKEIGDILGTSAATVNVTMARWRKKQIQQQERETIDGLEKTTEADLREVRRRPKRQGRGVSVGRRDDGLDGERGHGRGLRTGRDEADAGHEGAEVDGAQVSDVQGADGVLTAPGEVPAASSLPVLQGGTAASSQGREATTGEDCAVDPHAEGRERG